jgi:hypothetical protein
MTHDDSGSRDPDATGAAPGSDGKGEQAGEHAQESRCESRKQRKRWKLLARQLSALAGGAAAIWLGIVFLLGLGWGTGLMGVGMILLIEQLARRRFGLDHDLYWTAGGALALIGGMLLESGYDVRIGPMILILIGIFAIISAFAQQSDSSRDDSLDDENR